MSRLFALALFVLGSIAQLPLFAANEQYAVIRIPSHGASATVIDSGPGYSWILGCAHAYQGSSRNKPMVFDIPKSHPGSGKQCSIRLVKVDYDADLSLVWISDGPLEYVSRVAWVGWHEWNHNIWSIGYDEMKMPPQMRQAHIVEETRNDYYTREKPWHGRSGGGLIDTDSGVLVGVVQGYMTTPPSYGMYVNLKTIQRFLQGASGPPYSQQPSDPFNQQYKQLQPQFRQRQMTPSPGCGPGG